MVKIKKPALRKQALEDNENERNTKKEDRKDNSPPIENEITSTTSGFHSSTSTKRSTKTSSILL